MFDAIKRGAENRRADLLDRERPVAQQSALLANQQRDPKKQRKPFEMMDFCIYKTREDMNLPAGHYGSAYMQLVERKLIPAWGLFVFKEMSQGANPNYKSKEPAFISEHAILLNPRKEAGGYKGMLLALEAAGDQVITFTTGKGERIPLYVPAVPTKVIAQEDVTLLLS